MFEVVSVLVLRSPIDVCPASPPVPPDLDVFDQLGAVQLAAADRSLTNHEVTVLGRLNEVTRRFVFSPVILVTDSIRLTNGAVRDPIPPATVWHSRTCGAGSPPEISLRQVGEFPLDSTLSVLKRRYSDHWSRAAWPVSEDSAVKAFKAGVDPGHYAGIKFQLGCFELEGTQLTDSLDDRAPFRVWGVMGVGGVLPHGVPLDATWNQLRAAFGDRYVVDRGEIEGMPGMIRFCSLPGFGFYVKGYLPGPRGGEAQPIPPNARIHEILIEPSDSTPTCRSSP